MTTFLLWLPWVFRGLSILSAITGLFQGQQVLSGGYSASPWNLAAIGGWLSASAGSWVMSWITRPTSWDQIKVWLDRVFKWVHDKAKIDPQNQTDLDERAFDLLEEYLLKLLTVLIARWSPDSRSKAAQLVTDLKLCRLVSQSGAPSNETVAALGRKADGGMA